MQLLHRHAAAHLLRHRKRCPVLGGLHEMLLRFRLGGHDHLFLKSEKLAEGNKICYYSCPSGPAAFTVKSYELCPLNIKR
jgi:hypothetical protein